MRMMIISGLVTMALLCGSAGAFPDSTFAGDADSLFNLSEEEQKTDVRMFRAKHTYFLVTTCKTIAVPYDRVLAAFQDISSYKNYFRFMKRSEYVEYEEAGDSVALFETGVAFYVAWYAGKISWVSDPGEGECRLICGNMDQRLFRREWTGKIGGLVRIGSHEVYLEWHLRDVGGGKTRVALSVSQAPAVYIPRWLMKIASGAIFPGMLQELEKALS